MFKCTENLIYPPTRSIKYYNFIPKRTMREYLRKDKKSFKVEVKNISIDK